MGFFSRIGRGSLFIRAAESHDASGAAEGLLLRFGEAIEEPLQIRLGKAGAIVGSKLNSRSKPLLGHRYLNAFDGRDQLRQLRLGLHQRSCGLDHFARFHP